MTLYLSFFPDLITHHQKCDEKPDAEGNCQTCVRLRLQCLGFGAKRPDWMRVRFVFSLLLLSVQSP